jgi:hypothetical protein
MMQPIESCKHAWIADFGAGEIVCTLCGFAIPLYAPKAPKSPDNQSGIVSPGMLGAGLGTDLDRSLAEIRNGNDGDEGDGHGGEGARLLSLRRLFNGHEDPKFWITLTQTLKDRGIPEARIAMITGSLRKEISRMRREDAEEIREIVRLSLGVSL